MEQPAPVEPAWYEIQLLPGLPLWVVILLVVAGLLLVLSLGFVIKLLIRRPVTAAEPVSLDLYIDVTKLHAAGPSDGPLSVEIYGTPVRIVVLILAPVGREGVAPTVPEFVKVMEQLVPGFAKAVIRDQPMIRIWPGQLSSQGFANSFFNNVPLPGKRGKGTPWCCLAGKFTAMDQQYLTGIVCCGNSNNALGQYVIQHEGQWNDVLRVHQNTG